jgi:hypothetical protein
MKNRKNVALTVNEGIIEQIGKPIVESELKDESKELLIDCNKNVPLTAKSKKDKKLGMKMSRE